MNKKILLTVMMIGSLSASAQTLTYPQTPKDNTVDNYFGEQVADPYRWLENDTSQQTAKWVEAENAVTDAYLAGISIRKQLKDRLTQVSDYEKVGAPTKHHGKWYFFKNDGLQNQSVLYVSDELGGKGRVFLDPNTLSNDGTVEIGRASCRERVFYKV